ncbi:hypothetical protein [Pseudochryseolinea flava]|uniref:DUF5018 domain-containing protein n=1 Tax=Pseudochryseolinea flava TaxID=2059302 RepID=A0A364Y1U1_9BACT|nr:hypothetical protein [Pseudochryseolinea flava]RAW00835.1 hypothetical protein DQQ10_11350 [Pseudochryseolinea flava]
MSRISLSFLFFSLVIGSLFLSSCGSDDDSKDPNPLDKTLSEARLSDFPLTEADYLTINITHPVVENGVETKAGEIAIVIPHAHESLSLSLGDFKLEDDVYSISPAAGIPQDFSKPVTYTISINSDPTRVVHYKVTVVHGGAPFIKNHKVTGFKFEKIKNPQLAADIDATKIIEYPTYSQHAIYVLVPLGTDLTNLKPTVTIDAAKLYYNVANDYVEYPTAGLSVDLKYPKYFYLKAENSSGEQSLPYVVVVDVIDPIKFKDPVLVTDNVKTDDGNTFQDMFAIVEWTNQGNHPITGMAAFEYENRTAPNGFPTDRNVITASLISPVAGPSGVAPGEKGTINVRVRRYPVAGKYSTTVVFRPTFSFDTRVISNWPADDRVEEIFNKQKLTIESTLED